MTGSKALCDQILRAPRPYDPAAAARLKDAWGARWASLSANEAALVEGVAGCSPYLRRMMQRDAEAAMAILRSAPSDVLAQINADMAGLAATDAAEAMQKMRAAKNKAALAIALADIAGVGDAMTAAQAVSDFADAAVDAAIRTAALKNGLGTAAGIAALAMGKLGAHELNYSSDIDLIVIYEPSAMAFANAVDAKAAAVAVAKDMVAILQSQTAEGYVFRTDLRLRPDPGVSALAISATAAEAYYESFGQNWERMAFIKARAHAGDIAVGEQFLQSLRPFVWRKFLDYAAIEDVKGVKRQIHSAKGGGDIEFAGHDVKTGRGGIREIEFFAQTQQLILGGKNKALRSRGTLDALAVLAAHRHVSSKTERELSDAYHYLRHVEHRLQMINDEQTHKIPKRADDIERAAVFIGEENAAALEEKLIGTLQCVKARYDALFEDDAEDTEQPGPLVFTGVEGDPATIETLKTLGFARAEDVSAIIRRWHAGGLRATRSERARNILSKLMAPLLLSLSKSNDPDAAFFAFHEFVAGLPAGVQVFSLLANNVALFDSLTELIVISPFLGREMSKRGNFVESLLENGLSAPLRGLEDYERDLQSTLNTVERYEAILNAVRRWAGEAKFQIAAKLAAGTETPMVAAAHFTAVAAACIRALAPAAQAEMARQHGAIDGALCVVALGRLGAGEMTAASDIDITFVYNAAYGAVSGGGELGRALDAKEYFTRLVRRIVTALSAATEEGGLYEVDMALRPSGGAGPAAVSLGAFRNYYRDDAWTWEIMALTKAQVLNFDTDLGKSVDAEIETILQRSRDAAVTARDVNDMRRRLLEAKPGAGPWDVKHTLGGLTDVEFIVQYLTLTTAVNGPRRLHSMIDGIDRLRKQGTLTPEQAQTLRKAQVLFDNVLHASRAATGDIFAPGAAGEALAQRMAGLCGAQTLDDAEAALLSLQRRVANVYRQVLGFDPEGAE